MQNDQGVEADINMDVTRRIVAFGILSLGLFSTANGEDVNALIDQLGSWRKSKCIEASNKLIAMGKPVVPEVAKVLNKKGRWQGRFAARTLRDIGQDASEAIPELFKALDDSDELTRVYAVEALATMAKQADQVIPVLQMVAETKDYDLSEKARLAIEQLVELSKSQSRAESFRQTTAQGKDTTSVVSKEPLPSDSSDVEDNPVVSATHSPTKESFTWPGLLVFIRIALLTFVIGGFFLLLYVYQE